MTTLQLPTPPSLAPAPVQAIFSPVLFAIDFGSASLGAARWATTHVAPGADGVLLHVMPLADSLRCDDALTDAESGLPDRLTPAVVGGLGGFAATLDLVAARTVVHIGRPSACLAAVANGAEAALLVLGRRGDANRIGVGEPNVTERAARRTSASVLVVPEGVSVAPEYVVAAVDDSRYAPHVLRVASRLARMHEVPLIVLHVLSPVVGAYERVIRSAKHLFAGVRGRKLRPRSASIVPASLLPSTTRWLEKLGREHNAAGCDATEVAMGDPAREIVRTAVERDASLIVVGMRGADEAPPGSIGSVTRELLARAPVPVLAVNAP
jgi:nucleotide-binding universal stress UspA family protein